MSNGNPGEVPIIVQGGGSVDLDVPKKFKEGGKEGGKYKNADQDLIRLTVDGRTIEGVEKNSRIEIWCGTRK